MLTSFRRITPLALLLFGATVSACSSDSDEPNPGPGASAPSSTRISAESGGSVSDADGTVTLTIPAGALAEDTDITLAISPASDKTVSSIFDFGPDGLTFLEPAMLAVKVDAASIGDKEVAIALETNGGFVPIEGSSHANGIVTAPIEHFLKFAVIFIEGKAVKTACDEAVEAFQACGGELKGTWTIDTFCVAGVHDLPGDECAERKFGLDVAPHNLSFSFEDDGVMKQSAGYFIFTHTMTAPVGCFEGATSCEDPSGFGKCEGDAICTCTTVESDIYQAAEGTYAIDGNTMTTELPDDEGGTEAISYEFCVKDDKLFLLDSSMKGADAALLTFKKN